MGKAELLVAAYICCIMLVLGGMALIGTLVNKAKK